MIQTYDDYLSKQNTLTLEEMQTIHKQILDAISNDTDGIELYEELLQKATKYAEFRAKWCLWDRITKIEQDDSRTSCHNSLIVKFDMLKRYLEMQEKDTSWRDILGYEKDDKYNRKKLGDFACYLVFINSINAR